MTPIVGYSSDKLNLSCGKRTPWYMFGTILVAPAFMGIFSFPTFINKPDFANPTPEEATTRKTWYVILPALFNVGWASV